MLNNIVDKDFRKNPKVNYRRFNSYEETTMSVISYIINVTRKNTQSQSEFFCKTNKVLSENSD